MKITIVNGSPKPGKSNSEILINYLISLLGEIKCELIKTDKNIQTPKEIKDSDAIVFVFPLYFDSIPSHLLRFLIELENISFHNTKVYCIVNNGFFEGKQNNIAVSQIKNWCSAAGLTWGQAVGVGAGEMLPFIKEVPLGHGPNKNVGMALKALAGNIKTLDSGKNLYISPNWPRFLWRVQGTRLWYSHAKKNGLKKRELYLPTR